jgi:DNA-binding transcriptional ArsR family regulator
MPPINDQSSATTATSEWPLNLALSRVTHQSFESASWKHHTQLLKSWHSQYYQFVTCLIDEMTMMQSIQALGNDRRLQILEWLKDPERHFPPQRDGDLVKDGVCGMLIARKLHVTQPAVSEHLKILSRARFLTSKRTKKWTFYKRDEQAIRASHQTCDFATRLQ